LMARSAAYMARSAADMADMADAGTDDAW
jgi:hypothetical protein